MYVIISYRRIPNLPHLVTQQALTKFNVLFFNEKLLEKVKCIRANILTMVNKTNVFLNENLVGCSIFVGC